MIYYMRYHDSPLYYKTAREAAEIERNGDYSRAAKVWAKASRASRNPVNQEWSANRQDFCLMHNVRLERQRTENENSDADGQ
jgi:hypothetical protein